MLIVQKFGGSSLADAGKIERAAQLAAAAYESCGRVAVVLSAQGGMTDGLLAKAREISPAPDPRELDMLLSVGEQISVSLMVMALHRMGLPAVSLTGWQAGILTDGVHGGARVGSVDTERLIRELNAGRIAVVTGFQGLSPGGDISTLGRGGSDTTAVALASALGAEECLIYTDVDGIYTADPRRVRGARRLREIGYGPMLRLSRLGSQVLHDRSVELAMLRGVEPVVLSPGGGPGTRLTARPKPENIEIIGGVTMRAGDNGALVSAVSSGVMDPSAMAGVMLPALAAAGIGVRHMTVDTGSVSVLTAAQDGSAAMQAVHDAFFPTI